MTTVDTKNVAAFRKLRFESIEECKAEVERIKAADRAGSLTAHGNWSPGQVMTHVAAWINYAYDGFEVKAPPFFIRWFLRWGLNKMLREGMSPGVRIPGVKEGTTGMEDIETALAADKLLTALNRLASDEEAPHDSPAFGKMSYEDRVRLNLRHAEMHLGFLSYDEG